MTQRVKVDLGAVEFEATLLTEADRYETTYRLLQADNGRKFIIGYFHRTVDPHTSWELVRVARTNSDLDNDAIIMIFGELLK